MVDITAPEVKLAKAEVDNNIVIHQLTEVLSRDFAQGSVGALDLSTVQVRHLSERIDSAMEIGIQTTQAEKLLEAAKIVRRIRTAMVSTGMEMKMKMMVVVVVVVVLVL
jgi:hypothetical protein